MAYPNTKGLPRERRTKEGERANRLGADFLQIDSEVALTFSGIALHASDQQKRMCMTAAARRAYDTILRLRTGIELNQTEGDKLDGNLKRLKRELEDLRLTR